MTNKLVLESRTLTLVRMRALELLGKISDVGLFSEKSEVTITHQSTDDLREKLKGKLEKLVAGEVVEAPVIVDVKEELGLKTTMTEAALDFSEEDIQKMLDNIDSFSPEEVVEIDRIIDELASRKQNELAFNDLIEFCKRMQPDYIVGKHHRILSKMLMDEQGNKDRICVNIPQDTVSRS